MICPPAPGPSVDRPCSHSYRDLLGHVGKCDLRAVLGGQGKGNPRCLPGFRALDIPAGVGLAAGAEFWPAVPQAVRPRARARVRGTSFFMIILLFCAVDRKIPLSDGKRDCSSPWAQSNHTAANRQATFCGRHLSFCTDSRFPDLRLSAGPRLLVSHNGVYGWLPAYSDRIVRDLHLIPFTRPGGRHCPCYQVVKRHTTPIFPFVRAGRSSSKSIRAASARGCGGPCSAAGGPGGPPPRSCRSAPSAAPWPAPPPPLLAAPPGRQEGSGLLAQPKQLLHRGEQLPPACGGGEAEESGRSGTSSSRPRGASSNTVQKPGSSPASSSAVPSGNL